MPFTVAIVGRPNVGKSRLFNALLKKRVAIVHDLPGVTRDLNTAEMAPGLVLVDTGGWGLAKIKGIAKETAALVEAVEEQVDVAIAAADKILFVVDGRAGVTSLDDQIAKKLRHFKDKVTLIINKIDEDGTPFDEGEFLQFGFPSWQVISAEHGRGIDGIRNTLIKQAPKPEVKKENPDRKPRLAILGRPNVGKSSLTNAFLQRKQVIVSPVSGTTRDPVVVDLSYKGKKGDLYKFELVDTAGMRHRTKVDSPVEVFSQMRTRDILEKADVAILVVDALTGITTQDKQLAGDIQSAGKPLVIVINKWDVATAQFEADQRIGGFESLQDFESACRDNVEGALFFTTGAPIVFASALESLNMEKILRAAKDVEGKQDKTFSTPEINKLLETLLWKNSPRNAKGKKFKIYYAAQTGNRPYYIKLFCNLDEGINDSFKRYLARGFAEHFKAEGCPFFFTFVSKPKRVFKRKVAKGKRYQV